MPYADSTYYATTFLGDVIPTAQQAKWLQRASDDIDMLTYNRIVASGINSLSAMQQMQIKKATCYQAEHLFNYGDMATVGIGSYSVGDVSVSLQKDMQYSAQAIKALMPTGLTNRRLTGCETSLF
jgi:hypothetical protein